MYARAASAVLSVALLGLLPACRSAPPELSDGGPGSGGAVSQAPDTVTKVTKEDCTRWADHGVSVVLTDWKASASDCPEQERAALTAKLDAQRVSLREGAETQCAAHLGESYATRDAQCFLDASTVQAMKACRFAPMTNPDDSDLAAELERQRQACARQRARAPAPSGVSL